MKRELPRKYQIERLCIAYNDSTCPWKLRTDHEHKRHAQRARIVRKMLRRFVEGRDYREFSNGALYVIN